MKRGRGFMSGQVWDGEYRSQGEVDLEAKIDAITPSTVDAGTTYTGVPQPATPYAIPGAQRADPSGKIFTSVRFTTISNTLKSFAFTHKMVRPDGTYGEAQRQVVEVTAAMIAADDCSIEIEHPFRANRTIHLVKIKGKFTSPRSDDGGNTDQNPPEDDYEDESFPGEFGQTPLATFTTGAGVVGPQVENDLYNSKFKYECLVYTKPNTLTDNQGGLAPASALAMWRFPVVGAQLGGDGTRFITPVVANTNYWDISTANSPCLHLRGLLPDTDVCCRTQQRPWDAGEPFNVAVAVRKNGNWSVTDNLARLECYLEDSVAGRIATAIITGVGNKASTSTWLRLQFEEAAVSSSYAPTGASKQWVRMGLRNATGGFTLSGSATLMLYKPQAGDMQGAWKPHPNDRGQDGNPTAAPPSTSGGRQACSVGTSGSETPLGSGGQIILGNVN